MNAIRGSKSVYNKAYLLLIASILLCTSQGLAQIKKEKYIKTRKAPVANKARDESRNNYLVTNPPRSTQQDLDDWNRIVNKMQGVEGFDPVRSVIGYPPAEKNWPWPLGYKNNWIPLDYKKQVCCGILEDFKTYDGRDAEMDWNFHILPNDEFSFLISKALPFREKSVFMSDKGWHKNNRGQYRLEAEITPDQSLFNNVFFPIRTSDKKSNDPVIGLEGKEVCFYGPWVREWFHHHRPEIHPSEMIWWRENKGYYLMLIQDDSNRFDEKDEFDLNDGLLPDNWKPWAAPPLTAQFRIAFEIDPRASKLPYRMDIREVYKRFVVTKEDAKAFADADNGTSHALVIENKTLLVVDEQQENDDDLGVKFVGISKRADGVIQGYLQITTKVGGPDLRGDEGYHILYVQKNKF